MTFDPRHLQSLIDMRRPTTANQLQQFLCATNWMRTSIPEYSKKISPLHELMECCYKKAGKRTKRSVAKISLVGLWGAKHDDAICNVKNHLAHAVSLAHPKDNRDLCLFTDASDAHWAAVLTQVEKTQFSLAVVEQDHEPLAFLSGFFKGHAARWSIVEKEAFAVVEAMSRLDFMMALREVHVFTDHANLTYIFDPYGNHPGINRQVANKLIRWALRLSSYRYVIEYLPGEENMWADILTRWGVSPAAKAARSTIAALYAPIDMGREEYDWPTKEHIVTCQGRHRDTKPGNVCVVNGMWVDEDGRSWIPDDNALRLRLMIAAHAGWNGHRRKTATLQALADNFYWKEMARDVESFVGSCIHCMSTESAERVPQPLGSALHGSRPNEVIHFDYCYMGSAENGQKYVLIIKDDLSSYTWLYPCEQADAETTADALMDWFSAFEVCWQWVSDQGSHFKNELMTDLRKKLKCAHHFTLPYCP